MMAFLVCQTYTWGFRPGSLVPSYKAGGRLASRPGTASQAQPGPDPGQPQARRGPAPQARPGPAQAYKLARSGADEE
jgi:hypothetical protein